MFEPNKAPTGAHRRKNRTDEEKRDIIHRQQKSGLTVKAFCRQEGFHDTQFYSWKKKLLPGSGKKSRNDFVRIDRSSSAHSLEIALPNGILLKTVGTPDLMVLKSLMEL